MKLLKRINRILNKRQRQVVVILFLMMVVGALLETIGTSMILPFISVAVDPESVLENSHLRHVYEFLGLQSPNSFMILMIIVLIIVFVVKNIYLFLMYYTQYRFVYNGQYNTGRNLFKTYVKKPYEFYLDASTPLVMRHILSDVNGVFNLILTFLQFFTEIIIFMALFILSLVVSPAMTLIMSVFLGGILLLNKKLFGAILRRFGHEVQENSALVTKWLMQAMNGMKEIKVLNREKYFVNRYEDSAGRLNLIQRRQNSLANIPRLSIETVVIAGILGTVGLLLAAGQNISDMIGQVALLAFVAFRIMPSANRITQAINNIAYYEPCLDAVEDIIKDSYEMDADKLFENDEYIEPIHFSKEVVLKDITYCYPGTEVNILEHAEMTIPIGKSVGIIGPSGAGKSTAVDIILGLLRPQKGKILVDGVDINDNLPGWYQKIGYVPQMMFMLDDSIRNNVAYGVPEKEIDDEQVWHVLKEAQLDEYIRKLPDGLDTCIGERGVRISGGQRQRIAIARALYNSPDIVIFDEATSALDSDTEAAIMEAIERLHGKKTLIIVAHRLTTIEKCDAVYKVDDKKFILQ